MRAYLPSPSDERLPLILTDEQARHVLEWYALDSAGQFIYRRDIIERAKGWGKSPLAGAIAITEFSGPVCFDGWDAEGEPVGVPWGTGGRPPPWVQIAAVSEDQTDNTYGALYQMLVANDHRAAKELGIDDGRTRLYLHGKPGQLEPVTASAGSREGQRVTFAVLDETYLWKRSNHGVKLANTIRRNAAKMGGRTLETTNAPQIGEKSVAEKSGTDAERGFAGILHYATRPVTEPQPDWSDAQLLAALAEAYGDSHWVPQDRLLKDIRDPSTDWDDALRYFFNIRTVGSGRAVDPRRWDAMAKPRDVPAGSPIGLGFDGSISRDATVLRGCTADGYSFNLGIWQRPPGVVEWTVPRSEVHQAVDEAFARYKVGRMLCDTPKWWTEIEGWQEKYGEDSAGEPIVRPLDTNQSRKFGPAVDRWLTALREGTHTHDGDELTSEHVRAAHLQKVRDAADETDGRTMYVLVKGEEKQRIDAAVTDVLAYEAAMTMPEIVEKEPLAAWG
jgi:hypothetical protein